MTASRTAVFLSYASEDAEAARRICESLRAAGIEVWFDQSELRGGDVWDHKIRQQIQDCALFIPVISAHTEERTEGYFRLEWKLAVDRSYLMADDAAFIYPVVIDATPDSGARVPDKFRAVQWTRLAAGQAPPEFCQRVAALLAGTEKPARAPHGVAAIPRRRSGRGPFIVVASAVVLGVIGIVTWRAMVRAPTVAPGPRTAAPATASVIPVNSIAVLPFLDVSPSKDQEYFSDGLAEQLLNLLSKVPGMQVAARTSAFSFKGHATDVRTIGRQLLVANVLEGSVSRVGNHLRVTAQLERAANGYQIWSETYDRQLGDVFRIQDEIAAAVVKALKVSLLGGSAPKSLGTQNSEAYLVFLQGRAKMETKRMADVKLAIADFSRALKLDPSYASAYVELAHAKRTLAEFEYNLGNHLEAFNAAKEECKLLIERALALDPADAQAYLERGYIRAITDLTAAEQDYRHAIELNPNLAPPYAYLAQILFEDPRRRDEALAMIARAHQLDPLEPEYAVLMAEIVEWSRSNIKEAEAILVNEVAHHPTYGPAYMRLADTRLAFGHIAEAIMYDEQALKFDPESDWTRKMLILNYLTLDDVAAARQVSEQAPYKLPVYGLALLMYSGDWHKAADIAYAAYADDTLGPTAEGQAIFAMRMQARRTHDFGRALAATEKICGVAWSDSGVPTIPHDLGFGYACVAAGDMLIASGDRPRGERLLRAAVADMDYVAHDLKRGELFYNRERAVALALLGDRKAALAALQKAVDTGYLEMWDLNPIEPAFEIFRDDPEFRAMVGQIAAKKASERQLLDRLRAAGRVPDRGGAAKPAAATATK